MAYEATTDNFQIRNANKVTFVGTSNTIIDTTTGRIQTKGFQHNSNVITDISGPHGRVAPTLKKYPEIIFEDGKFDKNDTTNTYVQAGYTVTASSVLSSVYTPWRIFDDYLSGNDGWATLNRYNASSPGEAQSGLGATQFPTASGRYGEYIDLQLPHGIKVTNFIIKTRPTQSGSGTWMPEDSPGAGYLYGRHQTGNWEEIKAFSGLTYGGMSTNGGTQETVQVDSTVAYKYLRLQATHRAGQNSSDQFLAIGALEYYGYEEGAGSQGDTSIDTTFTSVMNTPQTTGANVYVDGSLGGNANTNRVVGPAAANTAATYDTTGKYWELNGTLTSNITVEANTFLEGDQPHAVSVWFNSSNLEANVSNTCVFSISDQEKLDSVNLDLQSNTWHNLTYAYQGEGGSRVTYLDGRKVAEDQAEDTFGRYPPFEMTTHSQAGYVVSANAEEITNRAVWTIFGVAPNTGWRSSGSPQYNTDGTYAGTANLGSDSGGTAFANADRGDWVKIELPYKFNLNYFTLQVRNSPGIPSGSSISYGRSEFIKNGKVWGSNDGISWSLVHTISGTSASSDTATNSYTVGSVICYKYFGLVITDTNATIALATSLGDMKLYGHRENDLVRLPDPTNVLKYPHVALTGPAQRGYVASASSLDSPTINNGLGLYPAHSAFDEETGTEWLNLSGRYDTNGDHTGGETTTENSNAWTGDWLQIQTPNKIRLTSTKIARQLSDGYGTYRSPKQGAIVGSNNGTTWNYIHNWSGLAATDWPSGGVHKEFTFTTPSTAYYKYYRLIVEKNHVGNYNNHIALGSWQLLGTEEASSVPIQIGGGNIDKVANFRVYDKFVGEDQALEIWDAQKDYFGRAKSSMTLYKGRLGLGTTEPEGRLAVLDEPHNLEEFPPRAMTANRTHIEGHGVFKAFKAENISGYAPYRAFDKDPDNLWAHDGSPYDTNGNYVGGGDGLRPITFDAVGAFPAGEWIGLELPYKIKPDHFIITARNSGQHLEEFPRKFSVYATSDGLSWVLLKAFDNIDSPGQAAKTAPLLIRSNETYKSFVWIWEKIQGSAAVGGTANQEITLSNISLFGTREQGQSVLHDGQLTLTKNLTVPRIGPALDADDTPRRDRLVVEYNTSTNPTFEGAVRDTSGRGNDGVFVDGASYDATEKALGFDGTDDHIQVTLNNKAGAWVHSLSVWVKLDDANANGQALMGIGETTARKNSVLYIYAGSSASTKELQYANHNADSLVIPNGNVNFVVGRWYHIVLTTNAGTISSSNQKMYVDGIEQPTAVVGTASNLTLNLDANDNLFIGKQSEPHSGNYFDGQMSSYKLYDTALTAEEV